MRLLNCVALHFCLLMVFSFVVNAQQSGIYDNQITGDLSKDTLDASDWQLFDTYISQNKNDSAFLIVSKKFLAGKHQLSHSEIIHRLSDLCKVYRSVNKLYQLQPVLISLKKIQDSLNNSSDAVNLYKILSDYYLSISDWKNAYETLKISDSLNHIIERNRVDSLLQYNRSQFDLALTDINVLNTKLFNLSALNDKLALYLKLSIIAVALFLLLIVMLLIKSLRKKVAAKELKAELVPPVSDIDLSKIAQHIQISKWVSALMLQKGRTGEDLSYLKILEHSTGYVAEQFFSVPQPHLLDEDKVIRKLKHIQIQMISSNTTDLFLLKDSLKRIIRLADIQTSENLNATTLSAESDVFIILQPHPSLIDKHRLPESVKSKLITIGFDKDNTIIKPFDISVLIDELMKHYEYKESASESVTGSSNHLKSPPNSVYRNILNSISEARAANDKGVLVLQLKLLRDATAGNEALHNWIDNLIDNYDEMNALQIELTLRNIYSYVNKISG